MTVPSPPPPPAPPRKGLSPLAWVGIGCGVVLLLGAIAFAGFVYFVKQQADKLSKNPVMASAELAIKLHPDFELVSKDEDKKSLTIKNVKTGEVFTLSAEDINEGRWTMSSDKGKMEVDLEGGEIRVQGQDGESSTLEIGGAPQTPSWVPTYPGGQATGTYSTDTPQGRTVAFTMSSGDDVKSILDFYERELQAAGLTVKKTTLESSGVASGGTVTGESADGKRSVNILVSQASGGAQAIVNVTEKP